MKKKFKLNEKDNISDVENGENTSEENSKVEKDENVEGSLF